MRTVFVRDDKALCEQTTRDLTQLASTLKFGNTAMEAAWIVGNAEDVASEIQQYQEQLGMNYLIVARIGRHGGEFLERAPSRVGPYFNQCPPFMYAALVTRGNHSVLPYQFKLGCNALSLLSIPRGVPCGVTSGWVRYILKYDCDSFPR